MESNFQEQIDKYILGKMSVEEVLAFENDLKEDQVLYDQYQFTVSLQSELKDRTYKRKLIESWCKTDDATVSENDLIEYNEQPIVLHRPIWKKIAWSAAAMIIIVFIVVLPKKHKKHEQPNCEIAQMEQNCSLPANVSTHEINIVSAEKNEKSTVLTPTEQKRYWERAKILHMQGKREECVKCLRILVKQEGIYSQKADSLLHEIYNNNH